MPRPAAQLTARPETRLAPRLPGLVPEAPTPPPRMMMSEAVRWTRLPPRPATRRFRLHAFPNDPLVLELRVSRTRRLMHADVQRTEGELLSNRAICMGLVKTWHKRIGGRPRTLPGRLYARMYLNLEDLRHSPEEIITHECTHAALAWARRHVLDLDREAAEELLCYANGLLTWQVVQACRRASRQG